MSLGRDDPDSCRGYCDSLRVDNSLLLSTPRLPKLPDFQCSCISDPLKVTSMIPGHLRNAKTGSIKYFCHFTNPKALSSFPT